MKVCIVFIVITLTAYAGVHTVIRPRIDERGGYRVTSGSPFRYLYRGTQEKNHADSPAAPNKPNTPVLQHALAPPPNDNFANSSTMPGLSGVAAINIADATREPGEPFHSLNGFSPNSAWWTWTAPTHGILELDTSGSAVETLIAVYTGNSIGALTQVSVQKGYHTYINAIGGITYQIAVMSPRNVQGGLIVVDYHPTTLSPWSVYNINTNTLLRAFPAAKGLLLYSQETEYFEQMWRTNMAGTPLDVSVDLKRRAHGISILDKSSRLILNNTHLFPPGTVYSVEDFDGKNILTYNWDTATLTLFRLTGQKAKKINERVVPDLLLAFIFRSKVYVFLLSPNLRREDASMGVRLFNIKLSKELWYLPLGNGGIHHIYRNGVCARIVYTPYHNLIEFFKKGERIAERKIDYRMSEFPFVEPDNKMNLLYWYHSGDFNSPTNSPLSYINNKGETVFSYVPLPGTGIGWRFGDFDGKDLYVSEPNGPSHRILKYRIGLGIEQTSEVTINNLTTIEVIDRKPLASQRKIEATGFTQYNKNLSKATWTELLESGTVYYLDKGTFLRTRQIPLGSMTNYTFKVFNKKGTVATHSVVF